MAAIPLNRDKVISVNAIGIRGHKYIHVRTGPLQNFILKPNGPDNNIKRKSEEHPWWYWWADNAAMQEPKQNWSASA